MNEQKKFYIKGHLWIKIFCIVYTAVIMLMLVFIGIWQHNNITYIFSREKADIVENQSYISSMLDSAISFSVLSEGVKILPADKLKSAVESAFYYNAGEIALYKDGKLITSTYLKKDDIDQELSVQKIQDGKCYLHNYEREGGHYIKAASSVTLQDEDYILITTTDISELYDYEDKLIHQVTVICVVGGMITALLLLIIFKFTLKPLNDINNNVRTIAGGSYDKRLSVKRNDELGELAFNVNEMAQAVGDNIRTLKEVTGEQKRFIDNLTHEMKTPLTSIICFAEILQADGNISREKVAHHAGVIAEEGKRLSVISQKLMDFIHIGKINECDKREVSMRVILNDIGDTMTPMFEKKKIHLCRNIQDFTLKLDYELFKTMVCNYLDNAMKASEENGTIKLEAYKENGSRVIKITDYGIGIPEEEISKIEEPFYMVDKSRGRKAGGAGLGMALCKKIVLAHGGNVRVTSKLNEGTEIKIIF